MGRVAALLPLGPGHVLITSRYAGTGAVARAVPVDVFARPESVALLRASVPGLDDHQAHHLAAQLGDHPLALSLAGSVLADTGLSVQEFLGRLAKAPDVPTGARPGSHQATPAAVIEAARNTLATEDDAAVQLLDLCAWLAPEPIPLALFTAAAGGGLDDPVAALATAPLAFRHSLDRIARYGLARLAADNIQVHPLAQRVLRERASEPERQYLRRRAMALVVAAVSSDNDASPNADSTLPHVLALDPASTDSPALRTVACDALFELLRRGRFDTVRDLASRWLDAWRAALGAADLHARRAAEALATAYQQLGQYEAARSVDGAALAAAREAVGDEHPDALQAAARLAEDLRMLGDWETARALTQDILARHRRVLGDEHPDTLRTVADLAYDLRRTGQYEVARQLDEDTLARRLCGRRLSRYRSGSCDCHRSRPQGASPAIPPGSNGAVRAGVAKDRPQGNDLVGGAHPRRRPGVDREPAEQPLGREALGVERERRPDRAGDEDRTRRWVSTAASAGGHGWWSRHQHDILLYRGTRRPKPCGT
jgi:hypothetical protein